MTSYYAEQELKAIGLSPMVVMLKSVAKPRFMEQKEYLSAVMYE